MRYRNIETISFTDISGRTVAIKDIRQLEVSRTVNLRLKVTENDRLDEIASRTEVYGEEGYRNTYRLFDQNAVRLIEGKLVNIGVLEVP